MSQTTTPAARDQIINAAKDLPSLLATAKAADPTLYALITGSNNKSVWYAPAVSVVTWAAGYFGLGWDAGTCSAVAGGALLGVSAAVHYLAPKIAGVAAVARRGA